MQSVIELIKVMNEDLNLNLHNQIEDMKISYDNDYPLTNLSDAKIILEKFTNNLNSKQKVSVIHWLKLDSMKHGMLLSMIS